jgi:nucleoid-associated protein YgaU
MQPLELYGPDPLSVDPFATPPEYVGYFGEDTGWFGADLVKSVGKAVSSVAAPVASVVKAVTSPVASLAQQGLSVLTQNPVWDIARTGVSFIPGVGSAVSAGMSAAAAVGAGKGLKDIALAAAKGAIPGGPAVQAAFDVGLGMLEGKSPGDAVLAAVRDQVPGGDVGRAAFDAATQIAKGKAWDDAALAAARNVVPGGDEGRKAFDAAVSAFRQGHTSSAQPQVALKRLNRKGNAAARSLARNRFLAQKKAREVAAAEAHHVNDVKAAIAAIANKIRGQKLYDPRDVGELDSLEGFCDRQGLDVGEFYTGAVPKAAPKKHLTKKVRLSRKFLHNVYTKGGPTIRKAILAHGLLARIAHSTGELTGDGGWTIRSGEGAYQIAKKVTGNGARWKEILAVNPGLKTYTAADGSTQIKPWSVGQRITLPPSWLGTAAPVVVMPPIVVTPSATPAATPVSYPVPTATPAASAKPGVNGDGTYTIQSGEGAYQIAQKLTGNGARWKELLAVNPTLKTYTAANGSTQIKPWGAGQRITLPSSWPGGVARPPTPAAVPTVTIATPATPIAVPIPTAPATPVPAIPASTDYGSDLVSTASLQVMLATFFQVHIAEVSSISGAPLVPVFGLDPGDLVGTWTDRTTNAVRTYQKWRNMQRTNDPTTLRTDGVADDATVNALVATVTQDTGVPVAAIQTVVHTATPPATPKPPTTKPPTTTKPPASTTKPTTTTTTKPPASTTTKPPAKKSDGAGAILALIAAAAIASGVL